jgi:hypothetical protein
MAIAPALALLLGGGFAAGAIGRLGKNVVDVSRSGSEDGVALGGVVGAPVSGVPVQVTPAEAEELRRKGVKVKQVLKQAMEFNTGSFVQNVGIGAAGGAALGGGWMLVDHLINKRRKAVATEERDEVKARIQRLLEDQPIEQDIPVHAAMKAAEAHYLQKSASIIGEVDAAAGAWLHPALQWGAGMGGLLAAVAAYKSMRANSGGKQKLDAYKSLLKTPSETPRAVLEPVEVVEKAGSPSQQAGA